MLLFIKIIWKLFFRRGRWISLVARDGLVYVWLEDPPPPRTHLITFIHAQQKGRTWINLSCFFTGKVHSGTLKQVRCLLEEQLIIFNGEVQEVEKWSWALWFIQRLSLGRKGRVHLPVLTSDFPSFLVLFAHHSHSVLCLHNTTWFLVKHLSMFNFLCPLCVCLLLPVSWMSRFHCHQFIYVPPGRHRRIDQGLQQR